MKNTQKSLEERYHEHLRNYHGAIAPKSFEKWREKNIIKRWYDPPGGPMQYFEGTREDFVELMQQQPAHTRYGAGLATMGETKVSPEEHFDPVNHPKHYTTHPSGIECIQITRHMNFNLGNAVKYIWRCKDKNGIEDLKKAIWYLNDEIERLEK